MSIGLAIIGVNTSMKHGKRNSWCKYLICNFVSIGLATQNCILVERSVKRNGLCEPTVEVCVAAPFVPILLQVLRIVWQ